MRNLKRKIQHNKYKLDEMSKEKQAKWITQALIAGVNQIVQFSYFLILKYQAFNCFKTL